MYKIFLLNGIFCTLPTFKYPVNGQENDNIEISNLNVTIKRYIIEDDFKPPIFGSFKYNPIAQEFDLPEGTLNKTTNLKRNGNDMTTPQYTKKNLRDALDGGVINTEERNAAKEKWSKKNSNALDLGKGKYTKGQ